MTRTIGLPVVLFFCSLFAGKHRAILRNFISENFKPVCYSKALKAEKYSIEKFYDATMRDMEFAPKYFESGFDFEYDPIITAERPKEILNYRWGFIPWFEKDPVKIATPTGTLNCKSEGMFETQSFRDAAQKGKRCLIPATSFIESH